MRVSRFQGQRRRPVPRATATVRGERQVLGGAVKGHGTGAARQGHQMVQASGRGARARSLLHFHIPARTASMAAKGGFHHRSLTEMRFGRACIVRPLHEPDKLRVAGRFWRKCKWLSEGLGWCRFAVPVPVVRAFLHQWRCSSCVPHASLRSPAVERAALQLNNSVCFWDLYHCSAHGR